MLRLLFVAVAWALLSAIAAQPGMGPGMMHQGGMGPGMMHPGMGGGMGGMGMGHGCNGQCPGPIFMSLLQQHDKIKRQYKNTDAGIESITTSEDPKVAELIKTHVKQMRELLASCAKGQCTHRPRSFDPLFDAIYNHADKLDLQAVNIDKGVHATETGQGEAMKQLVQAHAAAVSKFVKYGFEEHMKSHEVPPALTRA